MDKCPICTKTIEMAKLDKHIDLCLALNQSGNLDSTHLDNSDSVSADSSANPNHIEEQKPMTGQLEEEMRGLKVAMKRIRDIVINNGSAFHEVASGLYTRIDQDIRLFLKGFNKFRKRAKLIDSNSEKSSESELKESFVKKLSVSKSDLKLIKNPELKKHSALSSGHVICKRGSQLPDKKQIEKDLGESGQNLAEKAEILKPQKLVAKSAKVEKSTKERDLIMESQRRGNFKAVAAAEFAKPPGEDNCRVCGKRMIKEALVKNESCGHSSCQFCICGIVIDRINKNYYETSSLLCIVPGCDKELPCWLLSAFLPKNLVNEYSEQQIKYLAKSDKSFITCPNCKLTFYKEGSHELANQPESFEGVKLSPEAQLDLAANRYRCSGCKADFCAHCHAAPYHKGKTCAQFAEYSSAKKCFFCKAQLSATGLSRGSSDVCDSFECLEKEAIACRKRLPCGDRCVGTKFHSECIECVNVECASNKKGLDGNDFCQICWVESIDSAPCVKLKCGHTFHYHCVRKRLEKRWPAARITFGYMSCPLCKDFLGTIGDSKLDPVIEKELRFYSEVKRKAYERLKIEGFLNDKKLIDPNSKFYKKPHAFALHRFAFYKCHKCKSTYFGGMRNCEEFMEEVEENFERKHLVCGACSAGSNSKKCKTHGTDFLSFKCKFCCSVANWFCWGDTHFCDKCHKSQQKYQNIAKKTFANLPQCKGKSNCPLKIDHPPNGNEFSLGCVVCLRK